MEPDIKSLIAGIGYLASLSSNPQASREIIEHVQKELGQRFEEVIARRIEAATGARP